ncbi:MAG: mannose-1-phosphate guanylyltransferase [Nocardioidaceae bacterium]
MTTPIPGLHAIIPAGGAGTRLWPLSRAARPKFLLDLTGTGRTLLQQTVDRLVPLVGVPGITVVAGVRHGAAVVAQLPELPPGAVVHEPSPRDSMPAVALAAAIIARGDPDAVVGSFAADHVVTGDALFADAIGQAVVAARNGDLCTIGITPTHPSVAYGYVEAGDALGLAGAPDAHRVVRFVEKPDAVTATKYVGSGCFWWNAGMFIARADVLLGHLAEQQPRMADGIRAIGEVWETGHRADVLERVWPTLTKIAIDHALAEPVAAAGAMSVVPGEFGWTDIGDFAALDELLARYAGEGALRVLDGGDNVQAIDAGGLVIAHGDKVVTVIGIPDAVVIDTADALLVTTTGHAQRVRAAAERWRDQGRDDLL